MQNRRGKVFPSNLGAGQKGFTLVEALIVSAIMAILAVVAIPMYTGYINNQRIQTVNTLAQTAAVNANAMYRRGQINETTESNEEIRDKIVARLFLPNASYTITVNRDNHTVQVTDGTNTSNAVDYH